MFPCQVTYLDTLTQHKQRTSKDNQPANTAQSTLDKQPHTQQILHLYSPSVKVSLPPGPLLSSHYSSGTLPASCRDRCCQMEEKTALDGAFGVLGLLPGNTDPYDILNLHVRATLAEVRSAYRRKALKLHPDRHANADVPTRSVTKAAFQLVNNANATLQDPSKRRRLDGGGGHSQEIDGSGAYYDTRENDRSSQASRSSQESWPEGGGEKEKDNDDDNDDDEDEEDEGEEEEDEEEEEQQQQQEEEQQFFPLYFLGDCGKGEWNYGSN